MSGPVFDRLAQFAETFDEIVINYSILFASSAPLFSILFGVCLSILGGYRQPDPLELVIVMSVVLVAHYSVQLLMKAVFKHYRGHGKEDAKRDDEPELSATELLKRRYVEGVIGHEEFDRRMENIIAAEAQTDDNRTILSDTEYPGLPRDDSRTVREPADSQQYQRESQ